MPPKAVAPPVAPPKAVSSIATAPLADDKQWEADLISPFRKIAFYFALAAIFIRFSVIHEALAVLLNLNLYLLYVVMPPTLLGVALTGGLRRMFRANTTRYWLGFLVWLLLSTAFSAWRGGSANEIYLYVKGEYLMLFVAGGLAMSWKEFRLVMYTMFLAAVTDLVVGQVFMKNGIDRVDLNMGGSTIANSNDFAVHLILMTAFLLYMLLAPKAPTVIRLACLPMLGYAGYLILSTGSRGAMLALFVFVLFTLVIGTTRQRIFVVAAVPVMAIAILALLPRATLLRLSTLIGDSGGGSDFVLEEAEGSSEVRRALLKKSLEYTIQHPVFGVGPGRFSDFEGGESQREGKRGLWHQTHNTFTQISSECGIPGVLLFIAAMVSAFRLAWKIYRRSRDNPVNTDISVAAFCVMLGIVGFLAAATFANFGYRFYEPAICGLCIVMYEGARREMDARASKGTGSPAPAWTPSLSPAFPTR
jgi:O-antigen ligase